MTNSAKLTIRLSPEDMARLKAHSKASGLSQSAYLRMLIHGVSPKAVPAGPFLAVMGELQEIGRSMTTIAYAAQIHKIPNAQEYFTALQMLMSKILALQEAVTSPEKIEAP